MAAITLAGCAYAVIALVGARRFLRDSARRANGNAEFAPGVSILKPIRGVDPQMFAGFVSHCQQRYAGDWEIVFGVSSLNDPAVADVARLRVEFPERTIRLIECPDRIGENGKVSNLTRMLRAAAHEHIVINDSDIHVGPAYLARVMQPLGDEAVGLVTVPYVGVARQGLWARVEALGISTDFFAGVFSARLLEGRIAFGLGSTLATTKSALARIGGLESLVDVLADDYEMGARMVAAGLRVELVDEVVQTTLPPYTFRGLAEHQLRWARSTRDSRPFGYFGLCVTYVLPWALLTVIASGGALWSFTLLSFALLLRVAVALQVGVGVLRDEQVFRDLLLLPLRDALAMGFWVWSYASDIVVWRGERFALRRGVLKRV